MPNRVFPERANSMNYDKIQENAMVTRCITYLETNTLPILVIQKEFALLYLDRYPLPVTSRNRYLPRCRQGNSLLPLFNVSIITDHKGM